MKPIDERDIIFSRANYKKGTKSYQEYYKANPEKKSVDDGIRRWPKLFSEETYSYNDLNSSIPKAVFGFLGDIKKYSEGPVNPKKSEYNKEVLTKRLKGLAEYYGAGLVGITELKDYHYYTHRGRENDFFGEEITKKHRYGIVFACEMDKEMINRSPMPAESVETTKGYVSTAIVGMILSYYIRELGYEARNHMDGNYLLIAPLVGRDAGLGEIGRNTILTTKKYGSRIRLGVVSTNIQLINDEPISFGLEDFCSICRNCAKTCPSKSISEKVKKYDGSIYNWTLDANGCYLQWLRYGTDCGICLSSCPFDQDMETIKNADTFKGDYKLIGKVLKEFKEKYGTRPFTPGNPEWLK